MHLQLFEGGRRRRRRHHHHHQQQQHHHHYHDHHPHPHHHPHHHHHHHNHLRCFNLELYSDMCIHLYLKTITFSSPHFHHRTFLPTTNLLRQQQQQQQLLRQLLVWICWTLGRRRVDVFCCFFGIGRDALTEGGCIHLCILMKRNKGSEDYKFGISLL